MKVRRALVWIVSIGFGVAMTFGTVAAFGTTFNKFSESNTVLVFLSTFGLSFIWLDFILMTKYLKS